MALVHNGRLEMLRGNYKTSIKPLEEALIISKELNELLWTAITHNEIGNAYWYLNDYDKAIACYNESLKICKKLKRKSVVNSC